MKTQAACSLVCAAFAGAVTMLSLAGCFSERIVGGERPPAGNLCEGSPANVVQIRDFAFGTPQLAVAPGTQVTWVNCDQVTHTSTADGGAWNSGPLTPGATYTRTFPAAGTFPYHCDPHPGMTASVVVG
jgi:plastocyanin